MECRPRSRSRRADRAARDPGTCAGTPLALAGECSQTRSTRPVLTYYTYKNNLSTLHSITGRIYIVRFPNNPSGTSVVRPPALCSAVLSGKGLELPAAYCKLILFGIIELSNVRAVSAAMAQCGIP